MNVMFDMDGVLADFIKGFTTLAHNLFDTPITDTSGQPRWDGFPGMTDLQMQVTWKHVNESQSFWYELEPLVGKELFARINALQKYHHIYFVTSRTGTDVHTQTMEWLEQQGVSNPEVIVLPAGSRKGEIAQALQAKTAIDDKAGNAVFMSYLCPKTTSYIINRQYNQFDPSVLGSKVVRIYSVDQYLDRLERSI